MFHSQSLDVVMDQQIWCRFFFVGWLLKMTPYNVTGELCVIT